MITREINQTPYTSESQPAEPRIDATTNAENTAAVGVAQGGQGLGTQGREPGVVEAYLGISLVAIGVIFLIWAVWQDWIRPGSFRRAMALDRAAGPGDVPRVRAVGHIKPVVPFAFAGGLVFVYLVASTLGVVIAQAMELPPASLSGTAVIMLVACGMAVPAAIVLYILFALLTRVPRAAGSIAGAAAADARVIDDLGRQVVSGLVLLLPVAGLLALAGYISTLAVYFSTGAPPDPLAHELLKRLTGEPAQWATGALVVCGALGVPIIEEVVFRGFLQTGLRRATGSPWLAIVLTGALFALMHVPAVPLYALPTLFVVGITLGILLERRGLWACITLHALWNALQFGMALVMTS